MLAAIVLSAGLAWADSPALGGAPNRSGATETIPLGPAVGRAPATASDDFSREPRDFHPWWERDAANPLRARDPSLQIQLEAVVLGSLRYSPQIKVLRDTVPIHEQAVVEAEAEFDPRAFMESKFIDTDDPVGNSLTTGGPDRYLDNNWTYSAGLRRRTLTGAQVEASEKIGYENSNSIYFVPPDQGTGRLSLSLTQPLLNGAGVAYNSHLIVLAQIDTQTAQDRVTKELQTIILDVYQAYWDLYLQRALLLQKRKLYQSGLQITDELNGRREVDVLGGEIARAKAAVASRYGAMVRQETLLLNADVKLRTLINDPALLGNRKQELIPVEKPLRDPLAISLEDSLVEALHHRPEIDEATKELCAASVRQDVARNELMPVLNMVLSTYMSGLRGDGNIGMALGDQFSFGMGRPSYTAGMVFEVPLGGNRGALAKLKKRQLEIRQLTSRLAATTLTVRLEVEDAVREIKTAYQEMACQAYAILANQAEIEYLKARWEASLDDQRPAGVVLDDLLNAQDRLCRSESCYATAQVAYNAGFANLNRTTGTLIDFQMMNHTGTAIADHNPAPTSTPAPEVKTPPPPPPPPAPTPPPPAPANVTLQQPQGPTIANSYPQQQPAGAVNPLQQPAVSSSPWPVAGANSYPMPPAGPVSQQPPTGAMNSLQQPAVSSSPWPVAGANSYPQAATVPNVQRQPTTDVNSLQQPANLDQAGRTPVLFR